MQTPCKPARIHMPPPHFMWPKESPMLDLLFLGGGVLLLCLLIAYARLCDRL